MCPMTSFIETHWQDIKDFFNSIFFTAIAGSLAGAFAGAYGGQRIVERGKNREELLKEMRNTNAATMLAFSICNSLLAMKSQHIKALKENFDRQKAELLDHQSKRASGQIGKEVIFEFQADFQTLSIPSLPIVILQNQIFEKLSLTGRPLILLTTLNQTLDSLKASLEKRNQLIESYKASSPITEEILVPLYFGLPYKGGHINQDYPATIDAIYSQTNDGIFFSCLLCKDLVSHGEKTASQYDTNYKKRNITINKPDFSKAEKADLMPKDEDYADWFKMFVEKPLSSIVKETTS